MCNIAGYVGNRSAAPILIDMIKAQEGFNAGFYTGIATMHEGKIYYAKLTGDTERLVSLTDAARLPGNIGIIHSRTKSGGGDGWAHPFVGYKNGKIDSAYVANGAAGFFKPLVPKAAEMAQWLEDMGYPMNFKLNGEKRASYPVLSDGRSVHMSDVMCQLFQKNKDEMGDAVQAISKSYCEMPGEIVGILLTLSDPDAIVWSRITKPMFVGFSDHGACLASCAIAFPKEFSEPQLLPACSSGRVYADHFTSHPYKNPPAKVAELDASIRCKAYTAIYEDLCGSEKTFNDLLKKVRSIWETDADCLPDAPLVYDVLYSIYKSGKLKIKTSAVAGVTGELTAPLTSFCI